MEKLAKVTISSHNLSFSNIDEDVKKALLYYSKNYISYERVYQGKGKKPLFIKKDSYVAICRSNKVIRFHVNLKDDIFKYLYSFGYPEDRFDIVYNQIPEGKLVTFDVKDTREPYDYQKTLIGYILQEGVTKVITLPTGYGKTSLSLWAAAKLGKRLIITILGRYVNKWIEDVNNAFHLNKEDLLVIRGSDDLINIMGLAINNELKAKIIIITSTTMFNYLKNHEVGEDYYPIKPYEFYERLNVGVRLVDECHQFFHINFKMDLYANIGKVIFLSATLEPSDKFLDKMYKIIYPIGAREQGTVKEKYVDISAFSYGMSGARFLHCKRNGSYSHVMFENEIMSKTKTLASYLTLICELVKDTFLDSRKDGQKLIIFASTVRMCSEIVDHLKANLEGLTIAKYTAEDSWDNLHNNDIVVSTMGSAGTAVDIKDLKTCIQTVSIASIQQNMQVLGRLRKLVNYPDDNPEFVYVYCCDIPRQKMYHKAKYDLFKNSARSHKHYDLSTKVIFK